MAYQLCQNFDCLVIKSEYGTAVTNLYKLWDDEEKVKMIKSHRKHEVLKNNVCFLKEKDRKKSVAQPSCKASVKDQIPNSQQSQPFFHAYH